jgi:hypothetical protein
MSDGIPGCLVKDPNINRLANREGGNMGKFNLLSMRHKIDHIKLARNLGDLDDMFDGITCYKNGVEANTKQMRSQNVCDLFKEVQYILARTLCKKYAIKTTPVINQLSTGDDLEPNCAVCDTTSKYSNGTDIVLFDTCEVDCGTCDTIA